MRGRSIGADERGERGGAPSRIGARRTGAVRGADGSRSAFLMIGIAVRVTRRIGAASPALFVRSVGLAGASPLALFVRSVGRSTAGLVAEVLAAGGRGENTLPVDGRPDDGRADEDLGADGRAEVDLVEEVRLVDKEPSLRGPLRGAVGML